MANKKKTKNQILKEKTKKAQAIAAGQKPASNTKPEKKGFKIFGRKQG